MPTATATMAMMRMMMTTMIMMVRVLVVVSSGSVLGRNVSQLKPEQTKQATSFKAF